MEDKDLVSYTLRLPREMHTQLKLLSIQNETTISKYLNDLIHKELDSKSEKLVIAKEVSE